MHFFQSKQKKSLLVHQHIDCKNFPKKAKMIPIAHQKRISHLRQIGLGVGKASKALLLCQFLFVNVLTHAKSDHEDQCSILDPSNGQ